MRDFTSQLQCLEAISLLSCFISFEAQEGVRLAKDIKGCSRTQLLRTIALECAISEMKGRRLFINQFLFSVSIWVLQTWHAFIERSLPACYFRLWYFPFFI